MSTTTVEGKSKPKPDAAKPQRKPVNKIVIAGTQIVPTRKQAESLQVTREIAAVVSVMGSPDGKQAAEQVVEGIDALAKSGDVRPTE